ncbi:MAG: alpha/beta fold hydrolase [Pseudomonadota bacterium]
MCKVAPDGTAYELTGQENAPVIVLVHGLGLCRHLWNDHLPAFENKYRLLNYDLYGHGDSAPPPQTASLSVYAKQLSDLMSHLQISSAAIVGFSIGGMINRRFAMDYPNKVSALVILNSPHDRGEEAQLQVEERASKVREQGPMATLDEALKRWFTPDYLTNGTGVDDVRKWRSQVDQESYAQAAWVLANGVRELIAPEMPITKPAIVITCENDIGSTPKMSKDISAEIAGSELLVIPELKHLGLMEKPEVFTNPVIEFLARNL